MYRVVTASENRQFVKADYMDIDEHCNATFWLRDDEEPLATFRDWASVRSLGEYEEGHGRDDD